MTKKPWIYSGDVDIRCGGRFMDLTDPTGITVIQVTDLDSSIGFEDAYLIEKGTITFPDLDEVKRWESILSVCGYSFTGTSIDDNAGGIFPLDTQDGLLLAVDAVIAYQGIEDKWSEETVTIGKDAAESHDGWEAGIRLRGRTNLRKWVERNYL